MLVSTNFSSGFASALLVLSKLRNPLLNFYIRLVVTREFSVRKFKTRPSVTNLWNKPQHFYKSRLLSTGSYSDPSDIPGLAHFLERMLFVSTEKFPGESEYLEVRTNLQPSLSWFCFVSILSIKKLIAVFCRVSFLLTPH